MTDDRTVYEHMHDRRRRDAWLMQYKVPSGYNLIGDHAYGDIAPLGVDMEEVYRDGDGAIYLVPLWAEIIYNGFRNRWNGTTDQEPTRRVGLRAMYRELMLQAVADPGFRARLLFIWHTEGPTGLWDTLLRPLLI